MADDAAKVASAYFDAWKVNHFHTMRSLVDDDITFSLAPSPNWRVHKISRSGRQLATHIEDGKIISLGWRLTLANRLRRVTPRSGVSQVPRTLLWRSSQKSPSAHSGE
jgi:hypothetical protein